MRNRLWVLIVGLLSVALVTVDLIAQNRPTASWPQPVPVRPPTADKDKKPAPRRSLVGMWGAIAGNPWKSTRTTVHTATP